MCAGEAFVGGKDRNCGVPSLPPQFGRPWYVEFSGTPQGETNFTSIVVYSAVTGGAVLMRFLFLSDGTVFL
jgi:hypothetical protein